jgi:tol-pal system protein YbgF
LRLSCLPIAAAALALSACATNDSAGRQELASLRNEVAAMRLENQQLENRVGLLEDRQALASAASPRGPSAQPEEPAAGDRQPPLTVIKLKPRQDPAPPIDTSTAIVEPSDDQYAEISVTPEPASTAVAKPDVTAVGDAEYEKGMEALRTGNIAGGIDRLERFADAHPQSSLSDNALYYAGIGHASLEDYEGAAKDFGQVLERYPAGDSVAETMLKLAECRIRLHQPDDARALYGRIAKDFPGTAAASTAQQRLASNDVIERNP